MKFVVVSFCRNVEQNQLIWFDCDASNHLDAVQMERQHIFDRNLEHYNRKFKKLFGDYCGKPPRKDQIVEFDPPKNGHKLCHKTAHWGVYPENDPDNVKYFGYPEDKS